MSKAQGFDYNRLLKDAKVRWLRPAEIMYILQNHERYSISPDPPQKPHSGSMYLFNRRVLRYFRKDGHSWRKKKDGKNVGEAHERLKVGNVDALNCYYAHGEHNPYFQRRSYWMLDPAYEHIVLVHYLEVSEGRFLCGPMSNISADSSSTLNQSGGASNVNYQGITSGTSEPYDSNARSCSPGTVEEVSSKFVTGNSDINQLHSDATPRPVSEALRKLAEQLSLDREDENTVYFGEKYSTICSEYEKPQDLGIWDYNTSEPSQQLDENFFHGVEHWKHDQIESRKHHDYSSNPLLKVSGDNRKQGSRSLGSSYSTEITQGPWNDMVELPSSFSRINSHGKSSDSFIPVGVLDSSISKLNADGTYFSGRSMQNGVLSSSEREKISVVQFEHPEQFTWPQPDCGENKAGNRFTGLLSPDSDLSLQLSATREFLLGPENPNESLISTLQFSNVQIQNTSRNNIHEHGMDMPKVIKETSTEWMGAIELAIPDNPYCSDLSTLWPDQGQFGFFLKDDSSVTVAEKQRFSIREISPEWAFSSESTKVIITGVFPCNLSECPWSIMFGDIEVPAEIVQEGVLRCMTPQHGDGKVTLCVTSRYREFCSEVREFEFRAKSATFIETSSKEDKCSNSEELLLLVKLVHLLLYGSDESPTLEGGIGTVNEHSRVLKDEAKWSEITNALLIHSRVPSGTMEWIMQELLKDKLQQWISSKCEGRDCLLSKQEQGVIHMISGLGYQWALNPILDAGVGINFRDTNGWTALHWAARFGREEMVAALLAAGASTGAVTDPTPLDPVGKTAGAIAATSGHTGLAGYLSEASLTSHLSSLSVEENEISEGFAEVEVDREVEDISKRSIQIHTGGTEDELSLKDSLAAVRNAAQAAARIQAAFRAHSFRKGQQIATTSQDDYYGMSPGDIHGLSSLSKLQRAAHCSRDLTFDKAALSIQKKYRGWKGRKDFLTYRQHVVKIQAHVRGHQERKKYKAIVSMVSVLEKAVLRWRRKGVGLRGYRADPEVIDEGAEEVEDVVKVFRKQKVDAAIDQAMSRVLSMVESPTARLQYRRMLERFRQAKADSSNSDELSSGLQGDFEIIDSNDFTY